MALVMAGVFTFIVFGFWVFSLPGKLSGTTSQSADIFSTFKNNVTQEAPDLDEISREFKEVIATSSDELMGEEEEIIFEESSIEINLKSDSPDPNSKPIRIATTSPSASSSDEQNMVE